MSEALINRLVEFAESGNQQKIVLNGQTYQGWIMEITEEALLISTGYADKMVRICGSSSMICSRQNSPTGIISKISGRHLNYKIGKRSIP